MTALRVDAVTVMWSFLRSDGILHRVLDLLFRTLSDVLIVYN